MLAEVTTRKWGNSVGIVLPKELVDDQKIRPNQKLTISVMKKANFSHLFGTLPRLMTGQEAKDLARKGWK
ncbi:MAG: AbrB/MazE/SpoVT family DNA-binding domain-containing protein [Nanoarchaeota archaeon]